MKFYDSDTHEIFEATAEEFRAALDDYNYQRQRDMILLGDTPHIFVPAGPVLKGHRHFIHKLDEEYSMIEFEDKFVHFRWTEELKGKECFVSDSIAALERSFKENDRRKIVGKGCTPYPFHVTNGQYRFAYYDPNYDCKVAFNEGKQIQGRRLATSIWMDVNSPEWEGDWEYRIKPEEPSLKWTDLKVGDIICNGISTRMVIGIEADNSDTHIMIAGRWVADEELTEQWEKVEK
jgi:hypothetical protein